jgi:hypothetical protein
MTSLHIEGRYATFEACQAARTAEITCWHQHIAAQTDRHVGLSVMDGQTWPRLTLLVKSQPFISKAMGVSFSRAMY